MGLANANTTPPHPWLISATEDNPSYIANPTMPKLMVYENGALKKLEDCNPPRYETGDIVWVAFSVTFFAGRVSWNPDFTPSAFVRVGRLTDTSNNVGDESIAFNSISELKIGPIELPDLRGMLLTTFTYMQLYSQRHQGKTSPDQSSVSIPTPPPDHMDVDQPRENEGLHHHTRPAKRLRLTVNGVVANNNDPPKDSNDDTNTDAGDETDDNDNISKGRRSMKSKRPIRERL